MIKQNIKKLFNSLNKLGFGINYDDMFMLCDIWTYSDLQQSNVYPKEIRDGELAAAIVDNDDFKSNTLAGEAKYSHQTNVLYVHKITPHHCEYWSQKFVPCGVVVSVLTSQARDVGFGSQAG